jgi:hypothetical protein
MGHRSLKEVENGPGTKRFFKLLKERRVHEKKAFGGEEFFTTLQTII